MTYGSAANAEEVPAYLRSVRGGRDADPELVAEFQRRYRLIGWSPLVRITCDQGAELQRLLDAEHGTGRYRVEVGMLHSEPRIDEAVARLAVAGVRRLVGIVLSPQWSPVIMGGYRRALDTAAWRLGPDAEVALAGAWHRTPAFLDALAQRVTEALDRLDDDVPVLFTAHSLPKPVVDRDPGYLDQIAETIDAVVASPSTGSSCSTPPRPSSAPWPTSPSKRFVRSSRPPSGANASPAPGAHARTRDIGPHARTRHWVPCTTGLVAGSGPIHAPGTVLASNDPGVPQRSGLGAAPRRGSVADRQLGCSRLSTVPPGAGSRPGPGAGSG
jgi:hypothetical protein